MIFLCVIFILGLLKKLIKHVAVEETTVLLRKKKAERGKDET